MGKCLLNSGKIRPFGDEPVGFDLARGQKLYSLPVLPAATTVGSNDGQLMVVNSA
jgi:hypothetical protein